MPPLTPTPAVIRRLAAIDPKRAEDAIRRAAERLVDPEIDPVELAQATIQLEAADAELRRLGERDAAQHGPGIHRPWGLDTVEAITVASPVCGQRRPSSRESHSTHPGHRRVRSTRAGPSDDDCPAGSPAAPSWRRFVVDSRFCVVSLEAIA